MEYPYAGWRNKHLPYVIIYCDIEYKSLLIDANMKQFLPNLMASEKGGYTIIYSKKLLYSLEFCAGKINPEEFMKKSTLFE